MCPRIALLTVTSPSGEVGGAERLNESLTSALNASGLKTDRIDVTADETSFDALLRSYLRFYDTDLSAYDGVISTKAPSFVVRHRRHTVYLLHTIRTFYDMFDETFSHPSAEAMAQRDLILRIDTAAFFPAFNTGGVCSRRRSETAIADLQRYCVHRYSPSDISANQVG